MNKIEKQAIVMTIYFTNNGPANQIYCLKMCLSMLNQSQIIKLNKMVVYFDTYRFALLPKECKSFKQILQIASMVCYQPQNNIKLFFVHPNGSQTQIQSDSDLLSLKYLIKRGEINFKIQVCRSKEQIETEVIQKEISNFLSSSYDEIAKKEIERQINDQLDNYFKQLYEKILVKQSRLQLKKIEKQQVSRYMSRMKSEVSGRKIVIRAPSIQKKTKIEVNNPEKVIFKRKEGNIQIMVKRILESMMPVIVKELTYRIVEELKDQKEMATAHTLRFIDEENLEYL